MAGFLDFVENYLPGGSPSVPAWLTPTSFAVPPGTVVAVSLKLSGYREFTDSFQISEPGERMIPLEKREAVAHVSTGSADERSE